MSERTSFRYAFIKTIIEILKDRGAMMVMFGAVIMYSFFYPLGYQQQVASDQQIMVVDEDNTGLSRELIRYIDSVHAVEIVAIVHNQQQAVTALQGMNIQGYVVIPNHFEKGIMAGAAGNVALFGNGAWLGRASTVLNGLADALLGFAVDASIQQAYFAGLSTVPPIQLVQRPLYNTREGYGSALVTGVAELIIQQTLLIGLAVLMGTRREKYGSFAISGKQLLGGAAACVVIGFVNMMYYTGFMFWFQDYPQSAQPFTLVFGALLYVCAVVAFGLFVTSFFHTRERAYQMILITSLPLFFLSNLSWPVAATPEWLVVLAKFVPTTSGINMMVKFTQFGADFNEASAEIMNLLGLILFYAVLAWWRYSLGKRQRILE